MTAPAGTPVLWPLGVGERLDAAIKLYLASFRRLARAMLVLVVPIALVDGLFQWWRTSTTVSRAALTVTHPDGTTSVHWAALQPALGAFVVTLVLGFVLNSPTKTIAYGLFGDIYLGKATTWRDALARGIRRVPSQLWISLLINGPIVLGWGALVLVGIGLARVSPALALVVIPLSIAVLAAQLWWAMANRLAVPSLMMEGTRGIAALRRSWSLVRGSWWSVFGTMLLVLIIVGIVDYVLSRIISLVVDVFVSTSHLGLRAFALGTLVGIVSALLSSPISCAIATVLTVDMRVRKEGLDLELLTDAQAGRAPGSLDFLPQPKPRWAPPAGPGSWPGPPPFPGAFPGPPPPAGQWPPTPPGAPPQ